MGDVYVVAPDARRQKAMEQLKRPVFEMLPTPLRSQCGYISFTALNAARETAQDLPRGLAEFA